MSDAGTGWLASRLLRLLCSFPLVSRRRRRIPPDLPPPFTHVLRDPPYHPNTTTANDTPDNVKKHVEISQAC